MLAIALPPMWAARLGCEPKRDPPSRPPHADTPRLVCWFGATPPTAGSSSLLSLWMVAADGTETHAGVFGLIRSGLSPFPVTEFSRDSDRVTLHLYGSRPHMAPYARSGVFQIPNPSRGPFPDWRAKELPVSRQAGDVQVSLVGFMERRLPDVVAGQPAWRQTSVRLRLEDETGKPSDWRPVEVVLSDASGNELNAGWQQESIHEISNGDWSADLLGALPTQATAKVTVRLARRRDFPAVARFSVPIPPYGKALTLNRKVPVYGGSVVLERVRSPGDVRATNAISLDAHLEGFADPEAVVYGFEEGNPDNGGVFRSAEGLMTWEVGPERKARFLKLFFERQYTRLPVRDFRTVEFFARPTVK